jgi:hypothetical protein
VAKLSSAQVTATGHILGTPSFMSPEQFTGAPIDGRADLFSLGVILYWMATGDKPFTGETITAVSYKIVHTEPVAPRMLNPAIPRALESVLLQCLEKDPAARYQNGAQLAEDLVRLRSGSTGVWAPRHHAEDPEKTRQLPRAAATAGSSVNLDASAEETMAAHATAQAGAPARTAASYPAAPAPAPAPVRPSPTAAAAPAPAVRSRPVKPPKSRTGLVIAALAAVVAVVALGGIWKYRQAHGASTAVAVPAVTQPTTTPAASKPGPPAGTEEATAKPQPPPTTGDAQPVTAAPKRASERTATNASAAEAKRQPPAQLQTTPPALELQVAAVAPTSLEVQSDDEPVVSREMDRGSTLRVAAEKTLWLRTDSAGALRLKLNGYDLPSLGAMGMPRTLRMTPSMVDALRSGGAVQLPQAKPAPAAEAGHAHLYILAQHLPNAVNLVIWLDGSIFYQRPATGQPGGGPVNQEKDLPPGTHSFLVSVGRPWLRQQPLRQQVSGNFQPGVARTLRIVFQRNGAASGKGAADLVVNLE